MATYLQGVTDYIPQIQPWSPDFNLYAKVLDFKQSRQDAAVKQLSTLYGSLLNAPLTREDTAETRDKFFKTIDQDIKKMATLDLSKRQNVEAARDVFNQILDNDLFVKDMIYTKNWMSEFQKGQSLKGCTDPKKCNGQWWDGGDQYMNFKRMEFKNASAEDAMNFGNVNYVAKQDVTQKAIELAKELDIEIEAAPQLSGGFIITGATDDVEEFKQYNQIFSGLIGNDPLVREYYKAIAYNERMGYAYQNEQQFGSIDAANAAYINQAYDVLNGISSDKESAQDAKENNAKQIKQVNQQAGNDIPARRDSYISIYQDLVKKQGAYEATEELLTHTENVAKTALNYAENPKVSGSYMDEVLGLNYLEKDITNAAYQMAMKKVKAGDIKINEYELEATKLKNRIIFEEIQQENKLDLIDYKNNLENIKKKVGENGTANMNTPEQIEVPGATATGNLESDSYDLLTRTYKAWEEDAASARTDLSGAEASLYNQMLKAAKGEADLGDVQAKYDYIKMTKAYYKGLKQLEQGYNLGGGLTGEDIDPTKVNYLPNLAEYTKVINKMNKATTLDEKYRIAKTMNIDLNKLSGAGVDLIYEQTLKPFLDKNSKHAKLRKGVYGSILENSGEILNAIESKNLILENFDETYKKQSAQVIKDSRTGVYKSMSPIFEAYIDPTTGKPRNERAFVQTFKQVRRTVKDADLRDKLNDLSDENIIEIYRGTYEDIEDFVNLSFDELKTFEDVQLRDIWKAAYTEYVKPEANSTLVPGAGDKFAMGNKFSNVDPDAVNSNGMKGGVSFIKDALKSDGAIVDINNFSQTLPELADETIKRNKDILNQILNGMTLYKGKDYRPYFDITYTDVAGGNSQYAAVNLKVNNPAFFDKNKGDEKNRTAIYQNKERLMSEGMTVYLPKQDASASNLFVQNAQRNDVDKIIDWKGYLDLKQYDFNEYVKDLKLVRNPDNSYDLKGAVRVGVNENGVEEFDAAEKYFHFEANKKMSDILTAINNGVKVITEQGKAQDEKLKSK